jgi:alpha-ketoglutarate-dependent taurine dioxygenase
MLMTTLSTEKLGPNVGAEVVGVDCDRLLHDADLPAWTLRVLDEHGALVFRDLHIDDATQVAFSKRLGKVEVFGRGEHPEIFLVTLDPARNPAADYLRGTFDWHLDGATDDVPIMATVLSAHAVAESGGDTEFSSTYAAFDDLSEADQERYLSVRVVHSFEAAQRLHHPDPSPEEVEMWRRRPAKTHPLVWRHRSGRRSLVLGATTSHVEGMDVDEGKALLADLLAWSTTPERIYRHEWSVGDMVIWDNRGVLHRASPYDPSSPRDMHRTTIAGDEPIQ